MVPKVTIVDGENGNNGENDADDVDTCPRASLRAVSCELGQKPSVGCRSPCTAQSLPVVQNTNTKINTGGQNTNTEGLKYKCSLAAIASLFALFYVQSCTVTLGSALFTANVQKYNS